MSDPRMNTERQSLERLLQAPGFSDDQIRDLCQSRGADAPGFAEDVGAFVRRLENAGVSTAAARELTVVAYGPNIRFPWLMADEVVHHLTAWHNEGMSRATASLLACTLWTRDPSNARQTGKAVFDSYQKLLTAGLSVDDATDQILAEYSPAHTFERTSDSMERRIMFDKDKHRDTMNHQESREREQEKLEREQERLEREQERLERMQEQLEERQEKLEELEEQLEEIEIEDVDEVREVLDVVTERIPNLMRGIQDSLYSAEQMKKMGESIAAFYKSMVDAGMDKDNASTITLMHVDSLQEQMRGQHRPSIQHRPPRPRRPHGAPDFPEGFPPERPGEKKEDAGDT